MLKHVTKRLAFLALGAALLISVAAVPAQANEARADSSLVQTVQYYRYGPGYGSRFFRPGYYGRRFFGPRLHRHYGPGFYRHGYYGHRFYR